MMRTGMLWLDDSKQRTFEDKVLRAAEYYRDKYGRAPEICFVNKATKSEEQRIGEIEVKCVQTVLPHHFWLGVRA